MCADGALVGSGQVSNVAGGGSGFNNARVSAIPLVLDAPIAVPSGTELGPRVGARITCAGKTHASGAVRLWTSDAQARSRFGVTIDGVSIGEFLRSGLVPGEAPGPGPKVATLLDSKVPSAAGRGFTPFGTWRTLWP